MQLTQAQIDFNTDYLALRRRVLSGKVLNINAARYWVRVMGRKAKEKADKEAETYYLRNQKQLQRLTGYEKELMKQIQEEEDEP